MASSQGHCYIMTVLPMPETLANYVGQIESISITTMKMFCVTLQVNINLPKNWIKCHLLLEGFVSTNLRPFVSPSMDLNKINLHASIVFFTKSSKTCLSILTWCFILKRISHKVFSLFKLGG